MKTTSHSSRGFTLLELCIVLLLLGLLAGVCMPAMSSALTEQALRSDTRQFSQLVKEAMIKCQEEKRGYVLRLDDHHLTLSRAADPTAETSSADADARAVTEIENAIAVPDADHKRDWNSVSAASWKFEPNALCPMPRVRTQRGGSSIEMSFNALTGDVEDETSTIQ